MASSIGALELPVNLGPKVANADIHYMVRALIALILFATAIQPLACEEGAASYYAGKFQGRLTANGEIFDTRRFTAAHPTLPFDTIVRVTNIASGASTLARINDRGPFVPGRIIDLSRAAAAAIGIVAEGVAKVSVDVVTLGEGRTYHRDGYREVLRTIQAGAFGDPRNAGLLVERLEESGFAARLEPTATGVLRVIIPEVPAEDVPLAKARLAQIGVPDAFVRDGES